MNLRTRPPRKPVRRAAAVLCIAASVFAGGVTVAAPASAGTLCGFTVADTILAKARSAFGTGVCPTMNSAGTPDAKGLYTHFNNNASIYWKSTQPGARPQAVLGFIRGKWASLGWEASLLGFPVTDELPTAGGVGRFNHFEGGSIYWSPETEAHTVLGDIRDKWASLGWEAGFLGFPVTDETPAPDRVGRYNHFQGGSIYWKPSIGAHEVHGLIRGMWADQNWERGTLAYPISDEKQAVVNPNNRYNDFENGVSYYTAATNEARQLAPAQTIAATDILARVRNIIAPVLQEADSRIRFRGGLSFAGAPADYYRDNGGLHNRQVRVNVPLSVAVTDPLPDPTIDITLNIEINLNAAGTAVVAAVRSYHWHVHVPWPTSEIVSAASIGAQIDRALGPWVNRENLVQAVPVRPLSVKVMLNNTVQAFVG